ncbi:MAG: CHASE2 domain-containing protein [Stenomitos frigidus ULC029]
MVAPDVEEIITHNQDALEELAWAIESSQGQFSLTLARCNYVSLRRQLVTQIQKTCTVKLLVTPLRQTSQSLYARLRELTDATPVEALMVLGLESVNALEDMLPAVNSVREEFRKNLPFPIVFWTTDEVHSNLVQLAPDFESWATTTAFTLPPNALLDALRDASDRLFSTLLTPESHHSFRRLLENLDLGFLQRSEVEAAMRDVHKNGQPLAPDLQATLDFLRGLNAPTNQEALEHFQHSLEYWQQIASHPTSPTVRLSAYAEASHPTPHLISGLLLYFVGRSLYNLCNENKYRQKNWEPPRQPLQDCLMVFEQANRPDLVAKAITQLERVLNQLQAWEKLEALAQKSLPLQQTYNNRARQAQDYRYLALTAIQRKQSADAKRYAEQALEMIEQVSEDQRYRGLYLLTLAEATKLTGQRDVALARLNEARTLGDQGIPRVYIAILEELRTYYIEQKDYLEAFHLKQECLSVEQQYQLRAFVGAGRLRAQRQDQEALRLQSAVGTEDRSSLPSTTLPAGIASWQRQRDVKQLVERIGRNDCKLIVIHGYSGVGKSSLISAGLVPTLEQKAIGLQPNLPVVVRKYTDWTEELGRRMAEILGERDAGGKREAEEERDGETVIETDSRLPTPDSLISQLRHNEQRHLRTILIFDQFEEFFFVYPTPALRRPFFAFLGQCLQLLSVKVVLPLREDYLYYLLEFNRIPEISATGIDVLSRNVLYPLGNFAPEDARVIIQELTEQAHFYLEPSLVEALVTDLTDENGEVRPIELQIVGAQLQTDDICELETYRALRDAGKLAKEVLVGRYLAEVVADCGAENQRPAELVLYLLTDENNTRPLKTRTELVEDMGEETAKLDFVLEILVRSGLVMLLPEVPADRYQLVHDYLVSYIRQEQGTNLLEELDKERTQRKLSEARLSRLQQTSQIITEARQKARFEPRYKQRQYWINWQFMLAAFGTAGLVLTLRLLGVLEVFELAALDQLFLLRPKEASDSRIVIVTIDEADLQQQQQWPMSDATLARLLDKIRQQKPAAIGLGLYRDFSFEPGHQQLQKIFETTPNLIGIQKVSSGGEYPVDAPLILKQRDQVGSNNFLLDRDGKIRRGLLYLSDSNNENIFSLSFKLAELYLRSKRVEPTLTKDNQVQIGAAIFPAFESNDGGYAQADSGGYQVILNYRGGIEAFPTISMTDTFEGQIPPDLMRDRIVLIGATASSLKDQFYTSINGGLFSPPKTTPGTVIHANLTSQLLTAALNDRPNIRVWSNPLEGLWIAICCLIVAMLSWKMRSAPQVVLVTFLAITGTITVCYLALLQGWWLPLVPLMLALPTVSLLSAVLSNQNFALESLRRSLQLTIDAYREDPISARLAIEIFLITGDENVASREVSAMAIVALQNCYSLKAIASVASQLSWIPAPPPATLNSEFLQFLDVSQHIQLALTNSSSSSSSNQLIESSIATLRQLQGNLLRNRGKPNTKALREIAEQWLTVLSKTKQVRNADAKNNEGSKKQ